MEKTIMIELLEVVHALSVEGYELSFYNGFLPDGEDLIVKLRKGRNCITYPLSIGDLFEKATASDDDYIADKKLISILKHLKKRLEESDICVN